MNFFFLVFPPPPPITFLMVRLLAKFKRSSMWFRNFYALFALFTLFTTLLKHLGNLFRRNVQNLSTPRKFNFEYSKILTHRPSEHNNYSLGAHVLLLEKFHKLLMNCLIVNRKLSTASSVSHYNVLLFDW